MEIDVNEPYEAPPYSLAEYVRRLGLAIGRERAWDRRKRMEVHLETMGFVTEANWPRWYAWYAYDIDEHGREPSPPPPAYDRTDECLTTPQMAAMIGWRVELLEDEHGVTTKDGVFYREGDGWRFYVKRHGEVAEQFVTLLAAE